METHSAGDARPRFPLGRIVATRGALDVLDRHAINASDLLRRHQHGDWGDLRPEDLLQNECAVVNEERLLSSYRLADGAAIWLITEADRSVTTLLLPSEY